jgi:hypothetical protein
MKSYYLYIILWAGGCLIALFITLLWNKSTMSPDTILFGDKTIILKESEVSGNIVNELLLSANELNISGSTLISPGYKNYLKNDQFLNSSGKKSPEKIYNDILLRKLEKVTRKSSTSDFTIKPVPENNQK